MAKFELAQEPEFASEKIDQKNAEKGVSSANKNPSERELLHEDSKYSAVMNQILAKELASDKERYLRIIKEGKITPADESLIASSRKKAIEYVHTVEEFMNVIKQRNGRLIEGALAHSPELGRIADKIGTQGAKDMIQDEVFWQKKLVEKPKALDDLEKSIGTLSQANERTSKKMKSLKDFADELKLPEEQLKEILNIDDKKEREKQLEDLLNNEIQKPLLLKFWRSREKKKQGIIKQAKNDFRNISNQYRSLLGNMMNAYQEVGASINDQVKNDKDFQGRLDIAFQTGDIKLAEEQLTIPAARRLLSEDNLKAEKEAFSDYLVEEAEIKATDSVKTQIKNAPNAEGKRNAAKQWFGTLGTSGGGGGGGETQGNLLNGFASRNRDILQVEGSFIGKMVRAILDDVLSKS